MKAKPFIVVVVAVIVVASAVVTWRNRARAQAARTERIVVEEQRRATDDELRRAEERFASVEREVTALLARAGEFKSPNAAAVTADRADATPPADPMRAFRDDPKMQLLHLAARRASLEATYGVLFRRLGLSPAQIDAFTANVIRLDEMQMDLAASIHAQGLAFNDPAVGALYAKAHENYRAAQRELLGGAGLEQWSDYERSASVRDMVSGWVGVACVAGVAISPVQAEQLTEIMTKAAGPYQANHWVNPASIDWNQAESEAAGLLSDEQLALIKSIEPVGPRNAGGRYLTMLNDLITKAAEADAVAGTVRPDPVR